MSQLPADCLYEVFESLEDVDAKFPFDFSGKRSNNYHSLIACLPDESKRILSEKNIVLIYRNRNLPLFNYEMFVKCLNINELERICWK